MKGGDLFSGPRFRFDGDPGIRPQRDLLAAKGDRRRRPVVTDLVPRLLAALDDRGWVAGATLSVELGADLRSLREAANKSAGLVLGGNKGYALCRQAPLADVDAVIGRFLSQSREMKRRALEISRVRHGNCTDTGTAA